jgi:hypothetical protein
MPGLEDWNASLSLQSLDWRHYPASDKHRLMAIKAHLSTPSRYGGIHFDMLRHTSKLLPAKPFCALIAPRSIATHVRG